MSAKRGDEHDDQFDDSNAYDGSHNHGHDHDRRLARPSNFDNFNVARGVHNDHDDNSQGILSSSTSSATNSHTSSTAKNMAFGENVYNAISKAKLRRKNELDTFNIVPLPKHIIGGMRDQIDTFKTCNCKASNCLKVRTEVKSCTLFFWRPLATFHNVLNYLSEIFFCAVRVSL